TSRLRHSRPHAFIIRPAHTTVSNFSIHDEQFTLCCGVRQYALTWRNCHSRRCCRFWKTTMMEGNPVKGSSSQLTQKWFARLSSCALVLMMFSASAQAVDEARLTEALNSPDRPAEDKARDASRQPVAVLDFLGLEDGMTA